MMIMMMMIMMMMILLENDCEVISDDGRRYYKIGIDTAIRPFRKKIFESTFNGTTIK